MNPKCETCKGHGRLTGACMGGLVDYECHECNGSGKQPTPTTDTQRLRELLAAATPGPWTSEGNSVKFPSHDWVSYGDHMLKEDADLIAALRNEAPELLDEIASLRKDFAIARSLKWYSLCMETAASLNCERTTEIHEAVTKLISERDKLREEVERLKAAIDAIPST